MRLLAFNLAPDLGSSLFLALQVGLPTRHAACAMRERWCIDAPAFSHRALQSYGLGAVLCSGDRGFMVGKSGALLVCDPRTGSGASALPARCRAAACPSRVSRVPRVVLAVLLEDT
ncbi:hypothetical protein PQR14_22165 [Paraburkholderia bryophila]|uniref:hypothetical protein n=1 Tax=Paraburkholderia bryophila TaxID=420952 RepID=UPI0038BBFD1C